jgi:hypothetical protein
MITAKKVRLMLLMPVILAIIILSGCLDKNPKNDSSKNTEQTKK